MRDLMVHKDKDLVIEGYPRSANTFAAFAFQAANPRADICFHVHASAQVMRSVALGVPTLVLIRNPVDAVRSLVIREQVVPPRTAFQWYIHYYNDIYPLREGFVVARFEDVISDFGAVIGRVNDRFGTTFVPFRHTEEAVSAVFRRIDMGYKNLGKGNINPNQVARPDKEKESLKASMAMDVDDEILESATSLFEHFSMLADRG
jgi:hypothetical protein